MAGWSQLVDGWPADPGQLRELATLEAIRSGYFIEPDWFSLTIAAHQHELTITVAGAPLRIGAPGDSIQAAVSHWGAQKIADALGTVVSTAKLYDAITAAALDWGSFYDGGKATARQIWTPQTQGAPATTTAIQEASAWRDALGLRGLTAGPWKEWINQRALLQPQAMKYGEAQAINYGFATLAPAVAPPTPGPRPSMTEPGRFRVWQRPGFFHDYWHSDYSQLYRPIYRDGWLVGPTFPDGALVTLAELSEHPELWRLVRTDGPAPMRHPWIPLDEDSADPPLLVLPTTPPEPARSWATTAAAGIVGAGVLAAAVAYEVKL